MELTEIRRLSIEERIRLIELIRSTINEEEVPDVPVEPHHREVVLEARRRFHENSDLGKPVEDVVARIRAKR
jgi:hypothetical protein